MNTITDMKASTPEHIMQADVVVFQELGSTSSLEAFNFAREKGKQVIVEIDDFLHTVSPNNPGSECWNPGTLYLHRTISEIRQADALTVSTPQLAREYFPYNPNIYILPNYLNEDKWDNPQTKKKDGYVRIGWAGGNAHIDDLRMVVKVIEKIIHDYKGKVKFETMGMMKQELHGIFKGLEEFNDTCPKCGYQGESITYAGEQLDNYPLVLAAYGWDIAIAPIIDNAFNSAKSDLKLKEYSAIGYPVVASRVTPYIEAKALGCDVKLAGNFDEWFLKIKALIDNPKLRDDMVRKNKDWVAKYWIDDNISKYAEIYKRIIEKHKAVASK